MRVLLSSDYHINQDKRFEDTADILEFIYQKTVEIKPDYFVCLGDVFDKRKPTPKEMKLLNNWLLQLRAHVKNSIILLEGNHDQDNSVSGLDYLRDLDVDKIKVVAPPVRYYFEEGKPGFYFGHEQIDGAVSDGGIKLHGGSDLTKIMECYKHDCNVFAFGHFHKPQILKEAPLAFYCGSINKGTFGEAEDKKLLWLFEHNQLVCNYVIPTRPMFQFEFDINSNQEHKVVFTEEYLKFEGALVKLVFKGSKENLKTVDVEAYKLFINRFKAQELKIVFEVTDKTKPRNEKVTESVTEEAALKEYFKNNSDQDELVKEGMEIVKKVNANG